MPSFADTVEPAQDRRRISVLLCELVETPALEALERDARHVVGDRFHTICHEAAGRLGGHVLPWVSDGVAIFFGHPLSRDDDALRAVRCGWEILRTLEAARAVVEREFGLRLATRVAIATGQAGEDDEAFGDVPRTAGAVQSGAAVDRVTVDAATRALAGAAFGFDARPGECFVVTGPAAAAPARGAAPPLVGRLGERALLHALAERAGAGTRTAVLIRGDAGIGKTRLVEHLAESARESLGVTVLGCACSPYHRGSALHALAPLAQRLGVAPADGTADAGAASPARRRREALAALADALEAEARQAPLLVVVEDLHWADPTTLELLWTLLDGPRELALMLVLTARSDFTAPPQRALQRMQLGRLDVPECRRVVEHVAAAGALASGATRRLAQQAGGSPLLATQLTLTALATQDAGARAPATLYGCLMARLDRDCTARDVARLAATIGPEFDRGLLDAVGSVEAAALDWGLERLVQEGVVAPTAPGHFAFRHSLLQEAARSSQRQRVLRTHNAAIARALLEHFPHVAAAEPERVARHFEYAGEVRHAVGHWQQAGRQALERHALREATTHFERAIELNARTPDGPQRRAAELWLRLLAGDAIAARCGPNAPAARAHHARAEQLSASVEATLEHADALLRLCDHLRSMGRPTDALGVAAGVLAVAETTGDGVLLARAECAAGEALVAGGRHGEALGHLARAIELCHRAPAIGNGARPAPDPAVAALAHRALALACRDDPEGARDAIAVATGLLRDRPHRPSRALVHGAAATAARIRGDHADALHEATAAIEIAGTEELHDQLPRALALSGWARVQAGAGEDGLAELRRGIALWAANGAAAGGPFLHGLHADALALAGEPDLALAALAEGLRGVAGGERWYEPELHRMRAELLLARGDTAAAQRSAGTAVSLARQMRAGEWERSAAATLARLGRGAPVA